MSTQLKLKEKNKQLYVPEAAKIMKVEHFTPFEKFFQLELLSGNTLGHKPGQFIQLSVLGIGEAPISVSSPPSKDNTFDICVRAVGDVSNKLHTMKEGDNIWIRGPFGNGFDDSVLKKMKGKHLIFFAGGIGYVPLRSLINLVLEKPSDYKKISILYGCKTPDDRMYKHDLMRISKMGENVELLEIVDKGSESWSGHCGVITELIPMLNIENPDEALAVIVGPPIMYKFVIFKLLQLKFPKENIYMSLERRMKCGVGKCGHCQMGGVYVCQEGPVFNYADLQIEEEVL